MGKARAQVGARRRRLVGGLVRRGYSANRIQGELRKQGIGMRRKDLLKTVRAARKVKAKPHSARHVPIKYRQWTTQTLFNKHVTVYGTLDGMHRRAEVSGTGARIQRAMRYLSRHPPRKQFLTISADELSYCPERYLMEREWDERPTVQS